MQVTVRIPDHALEFAESMERLHLMLWLLPAKDLKEIVDYLSTKGLKFDQSLVKACFASYETIWRSLVEQLGLKRALEFCFSEFVRQHDPERVGRVLELMRTAERRPLSDAEVSELAALGATPFEGGVAGGVRCLGVEERDGRAPFGLRLLQGLVEQGGKSSGDKRGVRADAESQGGAAAQNSSGEKTFGVCEGGCGGGRLLCCRAWQP